MGAPLVRTSQVGSDQLLGGVKELFTGFVVQRNSPHICRHTRESACGPDPDEQMVIPYGFQQRMDGFLRSRRIERRTSRSSDQRRRIVHGFDDHRPFDRIVASSQESNKRCCKDFIAILALNVGQHLGQAAPVSFSRRVDEARPFQKQASGNPLCAIFGPAYPPIPETCPCGNCCTRLET